MMRSTSVLVLAGLILGMLSAPAGAGEATDQIRADIDELYRSVQGAGPGLAQEAASGRAVLDRMFDWSAMAEASLRGHWQTRTPAERAEFTKLFADLFARGYLTRINLVDASRFQYLGDTTVGDRTMVKTKVFTKKDSPIDVDYLVRSTGGSRWRVQDIQVESISLVDNYRVQFDSIITRSSYDDLVKRLRATAK